MRAHFVLAHPESNSFNAQLVRSGVEVLEAAGWTATVSTCTLWDSTPASGANTSGTGSIRIVSMFRPNSATPRKMVGFQHTPPDAPVYSPFVRRKQHLDLE